MIRTRFAGVALAIGVFVVSSAHVGSPNVLFDGTAGPYAVRVIVRPPEVVPGRAEVVVRVNAADVTGVVIRPVFWRTGARGAPAGDTMARVPGETGTFTGQLWLMAYGSYSVYVTVNGARGAGMVVVPVNSFATGRLPLSPGLGGILVVLGLLLFAGLLTIVRAAAGESLVPPGEPVSTDRRRRANTVVAVVAPLLALAVLGGAKWWNAEDARYQRFMYGSPAADPSIVVDATHRTLTLTVHDTAAFHAIFAPVLPDHGKMMHLFLVSTQHQQTFAHLHPVQSDSLRFTTELPWLPAGPYLLFGDITLENGLNLTVSNRIDIPEAPGVVTPSDSDDSWDRTSRITTLAVDTTRLIGDGYSLTYTGAAMPLVSKQPSDLRFVVRDSSGAVAALEPYLGMPAHAVVLRHDASVFIHLHPMGTVATASQQAFALRDRGDTTARGRLRTESLGADVMSQMPRSGEISFPYEFPKPGRYRMWVQVKPHSKVLTGVFDVDVR